MKIIKVTTLIIKTDPNTLNRLMDDYSDSGYMNTCGGDIIIDLTYIEDDTDQFDHFSEITSLSKSDVEGASYVCLYA